MSTATKTYLKHPVLVNPTKWIRSPKIHESNLYLTGFYNSKSLENNPFAKALIDTKADGLGTRFPVGSMIHLTADTPPDKRESSNYWIMPIINHSISLDKYFFTSHYMINNEVYVNEMIRQGKKVSTRFLPRKIIHRNGKLRGEIIFMPGFSDVVKQRYEQDIIRLLSIQTASAQSKKQNAGLTLTKQGPSVKVVGSDVIINIKKLSPYFDFEEEELFIPYEQNNELCELIIYYLNYKLDSI
ncbi:hypothetical protein DFJ63DRAFT_9133 [Scheffersomyces coipomensis]|uniref:uncharacterized protein n=1 Tax=Scheffersomyces coipomensis TaxID=1788519 RepID=UPI00315DBFF9